MLAEKELQKLFHDLIGKDYAQVFLDGADVTVRIFDNSSKLSLTTPIYFGGNYIPKSVRGGIEKTPSFEKNQTIKTYVTIDEENYRIFLNYLGLTETLNTKKFYQLVEDFCYLADEWRIYLDEHDKNDLVHIHAK